jgi:hypothetical protein
VDFHFRFWVLMSGFFILGDLHIINCVVLGRNHLDVACGEFIVFSRNNFRDDTPWR